MLPFLLYGRPIRYDVLSLIKNDIVKSIFEQNALMRLPKFKNIKEFTKHFSSGGENSSVKIPDNIRTLITVLSSSEFTTFRAPGATVGS